jgi:hypothetical protein
MGAFWIWDYWPWEVKNLEGAHKGTSPWIKQWYFFIFFWNDYS